MADWSARATPSPERPSPDAIWIAEAGREGEHVSYHRTRAAGEAHLIDRIAAERAAGRRILLGLDFAFGYPAGFAAALTGKADARAVWAWLARHLIDGPDNANNRFEIADTINRRFPGMGPFWGCPPTVALADLPSRGTARHGHGMPERRAIERAVPRAQTVWKLYTTGAVGSQVLVGLPMVHRLTRRFGSDLAVWPFDRPAAPVVVAEIYPALIEAAVRREQGIRDAVQVHLMVRAIMAIQGAGRLDSVFRVPDDPRIAEEGWILGLDARLTDAL